MDIGQNKMSLLARLLDASSLRGRVIAGNIANQNTPGFHRKTVQFEEQLLEAMNRSERLADKVAPKVVSDNITPGNPDGNNVNLELEMNAMRENRLTFETFATILQSNLGLIDAAIREGR